MADLVGMVVDSWKEDLMLNPKAGIGWIRERVLQITALVDSAIAVLLGFNVISWTADQVGLVMALFGGLLNLVAYADAKSLRDQVGLYEWDRAVTEQRDRRIEEMWVQGGEFGDAG